MSSAFLFLSVVIPAEAGIQAKYTFLKCDYSLDPRLHGDDTKNLYKNINGMKAYLNELLTV
ncbi:MAG: hypothetical protein NUV87_00345 [Candidatus Roizmanbacteria bacterium]|nr:hypothetical protein [Candidatus Roizmanbacteria bacterium]